MSTSTDSVTKVGELTSRYTHTFMNTFGPPQLVLVKGEGVHVWDADGKQYLDLLAGIAVNALGHAHPAIVDAVRAQVNELGHISNFFTSLAQVALGEKIQQIFNASGYDAPVKVFLANSGAEANEAALKLTRLHKPGGKVLSLVHSFHGRTMGALSATWKPAIREKFEPLVPNIEFVEAGNVEALHDAFAETGQGKYGKGPVAAVIMELIQGEAGVMPLGADYVKAARKLCDEHKALLIIDEVQTGIGRTGAWFAFQREDLSGGVTPDIVTFAKGVGGGFPMGGMISFGAELSALFTPGSHGSTFAGNPLGASAALATLGVIEEDNLVDNAEERGKQLRDGIASCGNPLFVSVRGRGLLDAIELAHPCSHAAMNWALEHGLIVNAVAPNALRLAPPLVITAQDVDQAVSILAKIPSDLPND